MMKIRFLFITFILFSNLLSAQYLTGKYQAEVKSRSFNDCKGDVTVEVHLEGSIVDSVKIIVFDHDIYHKIHGPLAIEAKKTIPGEVIAKQSITVDGITGATISSNSILLGIARAVEKGIKGNFKDGTFNGRALGRKDEHHSGIINISLVIMNSNISSIKIDSIDQITDHKRWGYYVERSIKEIPDSVISSQSLDVDAISGATNTSNAILLAVARALENALKNSQN